MKEYDFAGVVVAVTGAGHGFGRTIAQSFAALGAQVYGCDLSAEELEDTADHPGAIHTSAFDLTAPGAAAAWIADVEKHAEAPVGVLVSNAGGVRGQVMRPVEDVPDSDWHDIIAINLHAHFSLAKAVAPGMKRAGHGRIVTISSGAGLQPSRTGIQAYTSAKHGLIGLTRQLAQELGEHNITVNAVAPGLIRSDMTQGGKTDAEWAEMRDGFARNAIMARVGEPEDIARAIAFLAAPSAGFITAQVLAVDGGRKDYIGHGA